MTQYTILPFTQHITQYYHLHNTVHNITCTAVPVSFGKVNTSSDALIKERQTIYILFLAAEFQDVTV
jgi:hypothetical protein